MIVIRLSTGGIPGRSTESSANGGTFSGVSGLVTDHRSGCAAEKGAGRRVVFGPTVVVRATGKVEGQERRSEREEGRKFEVFLIHNMKRLIADGSLVNRISFHNGSVPCL